MCDPFKSARACAKCLKNLFDATGDWNLAVSGYNGGFIWPYLRKDIIVYFEKSYNGFLNYLEWNVNEVKKFILKNRYWWHKVKKGQTAESIAKIYKMSTTVIEKENRRILKPMRVKNERKLVFQGDYSAKIPISDMESKKKVYNYFVRGVSENLNYPPKFNAVIRIIEEADFQKKILERMKENKRIMLAKKR